MTLSTARHANIRRFVAPPPRDPSGEATTAGVWVYASAAVALGTVGLVSADFASVWQPVPANVAGRTALAYVTALTFAVGGIGLPWRRSARASAITLAILYLLFAVLSLRNVAAHPLNIGVWNGVFEQLALVVGAITCVPRRTARTTAATRRSPPLIRTIYAVCLLSFGATHFAALSATAALVPAWLPPAAKFWAEATGVFHISAGLAILFDVYAVLAARLFAAMLATFGALVWAPRLVQNFHIHKVWAANAVNLALIGAAWVMADAIAARTSAPPESVAGRRACYSRTSIFCLRE